MFGELWIDRVQGVEARLAQTPAEVRPYVEEFIEKGYVIFRGAVSDETVEAILAEKMASITTPRTMFSRTVAPTSIPSN